jgi:methanogenic corrinoid protein MtbC1
VANLLNIAALARRTGVAPDTLRKWEQRYGVLRPSRTPGGQRRYTESDVARVEWLRDRLRDGWRIGEAARVLRTSAGPALDDPVALADALLEATRSDEPEALEALLDQAFAVLPLETALADVLSPALRRVGDEWHAGLVSVAQEHALTAKVRSRLDLLLGDARGEARGTAVLACAPGEQHDLGLLMLAVLLRADGWRVEYLGQDTPVAESVSFAERVRAAMLCVSAAREPALAATRAGLAGLTHPAGTTLVLGGAAVRPEDAKALGATYRDGDLSHAVSRLRRLART